MKLMLLATIVSSESGAVKQKVITVLGTYPKAQNPKAKFGAICQSWKSVTKWNRILQGKHFGVTVTLNLLFDSLEEYNIEANGCEF